jgi:hypothetical protein
MTTRFLETIMAREPLMPLDVVRTDEPIRREVSTEMTAGAPSPMQIARRGFVLTSLGFLAACATQSPARSLASASNGDAADSGGLWAEGRNLPPKRYAQPVSPMPSVAQPNNAPRAQKIPGTAPKTVGPESKPAVADALQIPTGYDGKVIPRSAWTSFRPDPKGMEGMPRVTRITVHHEGNSPYFGTSVNDVKARLVNVLNGEMNATRPHKDIAYHYVIDPAGRVWEARDLRYEGRHTRNNYDGNIGVMCLGNFEEQPIPPAQLAALEKFIKLTQAKHRVARKRVYTHQELSATLCPGKDLQKKMGTLRSRLA